METKARQIREIASIDEWLSSEFYLGPEVPYIRPYVKDFILDFQRDGFRKFIATGASRTGKSYGVRILLQRILYEMSCYENFPCLFGLSPSTLPKVFWISYTMSKAESTGLKGLIKMIDKVPYWQLPDVKRKDVESELIFPFCEVRSGSNVSHIIGEDMLGCILDEANVRKVAKGQEVEEAQKMFQEMRQRSVMTFSKNGIWGGFSGIISSSTTSSSFVALELEKAMKNKDSSILMASVYEANPEQYSKTTFDVFIGDGKIPPFIVDQADEGIRSHIAEETGLSLDSFILQNPDLIEHVPTSIRKFYEEDISFALANMSGKVQSGTNKFITNHSLIDNMWDKDSQKPFSADIPSIGIYDMTSPYLIIDIDKALRHYHGEPVYVHVDASQTHDHTGFSALFYDQEARKIRSVLTCEFFMEERPGNQIDQEKLLQVMQYMRDNGVNFAYCTGDHYAKDYLIPQWKKWLDEGWAQSGETHAGYFSVDTSPAAYLTMLNYMKLRRYAIPYYRQLEYELENLIYDRFMNKVDHPHNPNGAKPIYFKDVADCLAAASFHLYTREAVRYEDEYVRKQAEKVEDWYSDIALEEMPEQEDTEKEFRRALMGEDSNYISTEELI